MNIQIAFPQNGKIHKQIKPFVSRPISGDRVHVKHDGNLLILRAVEFHHRMGEELDLLTCSVADEMSVEAFEAAIKETQCE